jgi:alginate O-acetyltransferase complex protein AlgI
MLFNSLNFALFLPIVFILYWFVAKNNLRWQNLLLLVSSYFFYACWDYRFMFLLIFSTFLDYFTGIKINEANGKNNKKFWLWLSIGINLGFLGVFKYYNFFASSLSEGLSFIGVKCDFWTLQIILPVGISFYTFHGLSYVIDIYKKRIQPEKSFIDYSVFVSFFPLLVAGPIERATHLLPQILKKREFSYSKSVDGLRQILWGLFKKIVIADNCADFANTIFNSSSHFNGSTHVFGALFFTFQIYADFSGYSDIALGTARLFGIELLRNFAFPYFSRDIAEFWRRWHISLSSWFKDYLYIPLGGSKGGTWKKIRNTFVIFLVSGFWHGANWTFIVWGLLNAIFIMPSIVFNTNRTYIDIVAKGKYFPTIIEFLKIILTFSLTCFAWIFFRAQDIKHALKYISEMFSKTLFQIPHFSGAGKAGIYTFMILFIVIEWIGREQKYAIETLALTWHRPIRWAMYLVIVLVVFLYQGKEQTFIYFQF